MFKARFFYLFFALTGLMVACGSFTDQGLQVTDAWARPGLAGGNGAIFFVIDNPGEPDALLSASSDVAFAVELHKTTMLDGVMRMEHQMRVPVPKGVTEFKPGDLHVMLIGLDHDLQVGDTFTVRLDFELSDDQQLTVTVKEP